tara:strand:- start:7689 stop:7970 length:282 start_codon:yes stop_codon:yes gene_type:complete
VVTALDGVEAVRVYRENQNEIGVVLSDLDMPRMNGAQFLKEIAPPDRLPVIVSTGLQSCDAIVNLRDEPELEFLPKPYTTTSLLRTVRRAARS